MAAKFPEELRRVCAQCKQTFYARADARYYSRRCKARGQRERARERQQQQQAAS